MMSRKKKTRKKSMVVKQDDIILEEDEQSVKVKHVQFKGKKNDLIELEKIRTMNSSLNDTKIEEFE